MTEKFGATRRRFILNAVSAGSGFGVAGFSMIAAAQAPAVFRFQGAWSSGDIYHEFALDYARRVMDMSGGRMRIEMLAAGAVVKASDMLDAVHKGVIDGCHATPALWARKNAAFPLFGAGPALGMDTNNFLAWMRYGGGRALYDELYDRAMNLNVVGYLYGPMPPQPLGWFRRPIASPAQLKGLKFHATGLSADLFRQMGAVLDESAPGDIVAALDRGQLDGVESANPASDRQIGLAAGMRVCMMQSYYRPAGTFEILFNRKKFEALPADLQAIARHASEAASADMSWKAIHRYSSEYAEMREQRQARFVKTPIDLLRAQLRAWNAVVTRKSRDNPMFQKVFDSQLSWARRTVGWEIDSGTDPQLAYDHWFSAKAAAGKR